MTRDIELNQLRVRLRRTEVALSILVVLVIVAVASAFMKSGIVNAKEDVLHVRGVVIEDEKGHARVVLGAPTPAIAGRIRNEPVNGILLLGPNGADRVVISYPGLEPQVGGRVEKRSVPVPSAGLVINDASGNERAGFGVSDDGNRVSLGLDYSDRDAMGLLVSPNFTGMAAFARNGERNDQITLGVLKNGTAQLKLGDMSGDEHFLFEAQKDKSPQFQLRNSATRKLQDVTAKLVP